MQPVTLRDFIRRSRPYERASISFSPALRKSALRSALSLVGSMGFYASLSFLETAAGSPFYLVFGEFLRLFFALLQLTLPWPILASGLALLVFGILYLLTRGFSRGWLLLHWATFILVLVGAAAGSILVVVLTITLINAAIWIALGFILLLLAVFLIWILYRVLLFVF